MTTIALYSRRVCSSCGATNEHKLIAEHPRAQYQCRNCNAVNEQAKPDELAPDPVDAAVERARAERGAGGYVVDHEADAIARGQAAVDDILAAAVNDVIAERDTKPKNGHTPAPFPAVQPEEAPDLAQLRERLEACERERDKAQADYQFMVDRAASAENDRDRMRQERDAAERQLEELTALVAPLGVREDEQAPVRRDERVKLHHWLARHQREREGAPSAVERELAARDAELAKALEERDHYRADRDRLQALAARPGDVLREAAQAAYDLLAGLSRSGGAVLDSIRLADTAMPVARALGAALASSPSSAGQAAPYDIARVRAFVEAWDALGKVAWSPKYPRLWMDAHELRRALTLPPASTAPGDEGRGDESLPTLDELRWSASTKPRISLATTDARLDVIERWIEARDARAAALRAGADERKDSDQ